MLLSLSFWRRIDMDQHYCLRWNKHLSNLTDVLISLLEREALCDVTLSVGNNKTIKVSWLKAFSRWSFFNVFSPKSMQAHQAILSACSPYFESIFIENTHPHPIMYMGNVDFEDLKAIIEYIYKGEVNIAQNSLQKFLKTAVDLQVNVKWVSSFNHVVHINFSFLTKGERTCWDEQHQLQPREC